MKRKNLKWLVLGVGLILVTQLPPVRSNVQQTYEQIKLLVDVLQYIREQYVQEVDQSKLIYGAASGMVGELDPFSQFMEPDAHKEMKTETSGQFGGLGIRISIKDGWLEVITPLPDTPAYRLGILPNDKVVKIDGVSTQGMSINDAVKKLRGKPKTKVTISVFREGWKESQDFTITREIINIQSVKSQMFDSGVAYLRLSEFIEPSAADVQKALRDLEKRGMTSLVFDLRNNPGGLLNSAVDVVKLFQGDEKLIVYTEGRASPRQDYRADAKAPYGSLPVALLLNRGSASGSEIVAGAFQDQKRAILIGSETFGKGSVQSVISLDDGSGLRLTTAKYYTPSGRCIHRDQKTGKGGITPDIVVEISRETEAKLQVQTEEVFAKDKAPESTVKKDDRVKDEVLERGKEILKAQAVFESIRKNAEPR